MLGTNIMNQYSLVEASCKKWPKNESDQNDYKYELHILRCNGNQGLLVEHKEETLVEEEEELETPSQSTFEEVEDSKSMDEESFGSCN
jgi:hypothetical protein